MTVFKICGLKDADAAAVAVESGAGFLGFVFVEGVRRQMSAERGAEIVSELRSSPAWTSLAAENRPKIAGLFANQTAKFVNRIALDCGLDYAQLCGDETPDFWDALDLPVIRQVKVREELGRDAAVNLASRQAAEALASGHLAVLDKHKRGFLGGTGAAFDWALASEIGAREGLLLAGGLTPENVSDAIATAAPWGVDVSTGVETGGAKDSAKMRRFAQAVRSAGS